uniref:ORF62b n=1 Tax=Pinus koraiensis TaxID=88728 RepID=Q85X14_PINKO|nr:ORF62b [Pinus koraiensis]AAO74052.2 ORF62b [Pinus koraiensis]
MLSQNENFIILCYAMKKKYNFCFDLFGHFYPSSKGQNRKSVSRLMGLFRSVERFGVIRFQDQ